MSVSLPDDVWRCVALMVETTCDDVFAIYAISACSVETAASKVFDAATGMGTLTRLKKVSSALCNAVQDSFRRLEERVLRAIVQTLLHRDLSRETCRDWFTTERDEEDDRVLIRRATKCTPLLEVQSYVSEYFPMLACAIVASQSWDSCVTHTRLQGRIVSSVGGPAYKMTVNHISVVVTLRCGITFSFQGVPVMTPSRAARFDDGKIRVTWQTAAEGLLRPPNAAELITHAYPLVRP